MLRSLRGGAGSRETRQSLSPRISQPGGLGGVSLPGPGSPSAPLRGHGTCFESEPCAIQCPSRRCPGTRYHLPGLSLGNGFLIGSPVLALGQGLAPNSVHVAGIANPSQLQPPCQGIAEDPVSGRQTCFLGGLGHAQGAEESRISSSLSIHSPLLKQFLEHCPGR